MNVLNKKAIIFFSIIFFLYILTLIFKFFSISFSIYGIYLLWFIAICIFYYILPDSKTLVFN